MMAPAHSEQEVFLGNLPVRSAPVCVSVLLAACPSLRLSDEALDIDGNALPGHLAVFIDRREVAAYDAMMVRRGRL